MPEKLAARRLHEGLVQEGLAALGYDGVGGLADQLIAYLSLLVKWNSAYNLTAVRDPEAMVTRHLLDSLAVAPHLPAAATRLVDVGSGAGLPGVPLALLLPEREFLLLDSNGKKTRFLFQVKTQLGLANMSIHQGRVETWTPEEPFDVVLSRAFASLPDMVKHCAHLCSESGCFLAMKGTLPAAELEAVAGVAEVRRVLPLTIEGLAEERHLVELAPLRGNSQGN